MDVGHDHASMFRERLASKISLLASLPEPFRTESDSTRLTVQSAQLYRSLIEREGRTDLAPMFVSSVLPVAERLIHGGDHDQALAIIDKSLALVQAVEDTEGWRPFCLYKLSRLVLTLIRASSVQDGAAVLYSLESIMEQDRVQAERQSESTATKGRRCYRTSGREDYDSL